MDREELLLFVEFAQAACVYGSAVLEDFDEETQELLVELCGVDSPELLARYADFMKTLYDSGLSVDETEMLTAEWLQAKGTYH